jgi:hypothetical protein
MTEFLQGEFLQDNFHKTYDILQGNFYGDDDRRTYDIFSIQVAEYF